MADPLERFEEETVRVFFKAALIGDTAITSAHVFFSSTGTRPGPRLTGSWLVAQFVPAEGDALSFDGVPWIAVLVGPEGGVASLPRVGGVDTTYLAWTGLYNGTEFQIDQPGSILVK